MDVVAKCHCGAVELRLARAPAEATQCNCSLCHKSGAIWAYYPIAEVAVGPGATETYAWGGRNVDFHRCRVCGSVTHWLPRRPTRDRMGVNARLLDPGLFAAARVRLRDGAGTGLFPALGRGAEA